MGPFSPLACLRGVSCVSGPWVVSSRPEGPDPCDSDPAYSLPACALRTYSFQRPPSGSGVHALQPHSRPTLTLVPTTDPPRPHRSSCLRQLSTASTLQSYTTPYHIPGCRLRFRLSHSLIPRPPPGLLQKTPRTAQAPRGVPGIFPKPPALHPTLP